MKPLANLWLDTPRWVRGFFLGNLCYIVYAVLAFNPLAGVFSSEVCWFYILLLPICIPIFDAPLDSRMYYYHLSWCLLGAGLVQWFGEKRGIVILVGVLYVISAILMLYLIKQVLA